MSSITWHEKHPAQKCLSIFILLKFVENLIVSSQRWKFVRYQERRCDNHRSGNFRKYFRVLKQDGFATLHSSGTLVLERFALSSTRHFENNASAQSQSAYMTVSNEGKQVLLRNLAALLWKELRMASDARRGLRAMSYDTVKLRCFTVRVAQFSSLRSAKCTAVAAQLTDLSASNRCLITTTKLRYWKCFVVGNHQAVDRHWFIDSLVLVFTKEHELYCIFRLTDIADVFLKSSRFAWSSYDWFAKILPCMESACGGNYRSLSLQGFISRNCKANYKAIIARQVFLTILADTLTFCGLSPEPERLTSAVIVCSGLALRQDFMFFGDNLQ